MRYASVASEPEHGTILRRRFHCSRAALVVFLVVVVACWQPLSGAEPKAWSQDDFAIQRWGVAEGLPGNHVSSLAQDQDGFLWLGTMAGLVRFDGLEFQVFNETRDGLPSGRISALDVGPSGRLWIGSELGHISVREHSDFRLVAAPRHPGNAVSWLVEDGDGAVWALHAPDWRAEASGWLWQWTGSELRPRPDLEERLASAPPRPELDPSHNPGGSASQYPVLARDARQQAWALLRGGAGLRLGDSFPQPLIAGEAGLNLLGAIGLEARASESSLELVGDDGDTVALLPRDPDLPRAVWLRDRRGLVWVSTIDGVEVHDESKAEPLARWELGTRILDLIEDREGNLWIATRMQGILRIQPSAVRQLGPEQGLPLPARLHRQAEGGALMSVRALPPDPALPDPRPVYRLHPDGGLPVVTGTGWARIDRRGRAWSFGAEGLKGVSPDGSAHRLARPIDMLHEDPSDPDTFWAVDLSTLFRIRALADRDPIVDGQWPIVGRSAPLFDRDGSLWIGSAEGLHRIEGDRHTVFDRDDGLPVNEIRALHPDGAGGLWIGTYGGGLVHHDGTRFRVIDHRHGLADNAVSSIVADDFGALWMPGNRGIQRVLIGDLEAFLAGEIGSVPAMLFGTPHGLDNPEATGPYSGVRVGASLYFSTFGGLAVIDPAVVAAREGFAPQVHLFDPSRDTPLARGPDVNLTGAPWTCESPRSTWQRPTPCATDTA